MTISELVVLDPDIIPNEKVRLEKEAFILFRKASNLDDAVHTLQHTLDWSPIVKNTPAISKSYHIALVNLLRERNEIIEQAITKFQKSKELK